MDNQKIDRRSRAFKLEHAYKTMVLDLDQTDQLQQTCLKINRKLYKRVAADAIDIGVSKSQLINYILTEYYLSDFDAENPTKNEEMDKNQVTLAENEKEKEPELIKPAEIMQEDWDKMTQHEKKDTIIALSF